VNGETVVRAGDRVASLWLPTVLFVVEDGERRVSNPTRDTQWSCSPKRRAWVYEMGIPIEPIEYPLSIDVGQRVPLREQRDTLLKLRAAPVRPTAQRAHRP
jgi:hypothetical protein